MSATFTVERGRNDASWNSRNLNNTLREKCPNREFFLVHIFPYLKLTFLTPDTHTYSDTFFSTLEADKNYNHLLLLLFRKNITKWPFWSQNTGVRVKEVLGIPSKICHAAFAEIVNGYKPLNIFAITLHHRWSDFCVCW